MGASTTAWPELLFSLSSHVTVYRGRTRRAATSSAASSGAKASRKPSGPCEPFRRCTRRGCRSATTATAKQALSSLEVQCSAFDVFVECLMRSSSDLRLRERYRAVMRFKVKQDVSAVLIPNAVVDAVQ